jgi:hypothetical protein
LAEILLSFHEAGALNTPFLDSHSMLSASSKARQMKDDENINRPLSRFYDLILMVQDNDVRANR